MNIAHYCASTVILLHSALTAGCALPAVCGPLLRAGQRNSNAVERRRGITVGNNCTTVVEAIASVGNRHKLKISIAFVSSFSLEGNFIDTVRVVWSHIQHFQPSMLNRQLSALTRSNSPGPNQDIKRIQCIAEDISCLGMV